MSAGVITIRVTLGDTLRLCQNPEVPYLPRGVVVFAEDAGRRLILVVKRDAEIDPHPLDLADRGVFVFPVD